MWAYLHLSYNDYSSYHSSYSCHTSPRLGDSIIMAPSQDNSLTSSSDTS
jgi:hypothetical protein